MRDDLSFEQEASIDLARQPVRRPNSRDADAQMFECTPASVGIVIIGRNEGERLKRCLKSLQGLASQTVYVDSGSSDDSVAASAAWGASVVELDLESPFTAARARNEGFRKLLEHDPFLEYVFFVDGDCEVVSGWLPTAVEFLKQHPDIATVWGNRRERYPEKSIYNLLCDMEWSAFPLGETTACGGDAVMRTNAFQQVNGFNPRLICGEEPELCVRLRRAGWRIWHLDAEMTLHDAALFRFSQWWKRTTRSGYAYALGAHLHGKAPERHWIYESRRIWYWGFWIPLIVLLGAILVSPWALLALVIYPLQIVRLAVDGRRTTARSWLRAGALVFSKFPEMLGQIKFTWDRVRGVDSIIIEYK